MMKLMYDAMELAEVSVFDAIYETVSDWDEYVIDRVDKINNLHRFVGTLYRDAQPVYDFVIDIYDGKAELLIMTITDRREP